MSGFLWGWVASVSPLSVFLGVDSAPAPVRDSLVNPGLLEVGMRVRCELADGRLTVHGPAGGVPAPRESLHTVADLTALDALDAQEGDLAWMTTPGTGVASLLWEASSGSGTGTKWRPAGRVVATTLTNLTDFISAVAGTGDLRFQIGGDAYVMDDRILYTFTSTTGDFTVATPSRVTRIRSAANLSNGTSLQAVTLDTSVVNDGTFSYSGGTFTCVDAGTYKITFTVTFAANASGIRGIGLDKSTGTDPIAQFIDATSAVIHMTLVHIAAFGAGETFITAAQQNSGVSLSVEAAIDIERRA